MTTQKLFVSQMMSLLLITVRTMVLRHSQPRKKRVLNFELEEFLHSYEYDYWTICHADLPYLNNFYAQRMDKECKSSQIVICSSKDSGTPLLGKY